MSEKTKYPNPLAHVMLQKGVTVKELLEGYKTPSRISTLRNNKLKTTLCKAMAALGYELVQTGPLSFEFQPVKNESNADTNV